MNVLYNRNIISEIKSKTQAPQFFLNSKLVFLIDRVVIFKCKNISDTVRHTSRARDRAQLQTFDKSNNVI